MKISVHVTDDQKKVIRNYASSRGLSVSEAMRAAIFEIIEDEYDLALAKKALAEWERGGKKTYTHEEVGRELGFL
ncbi:MAG: DUF6290 family protein [Methanomassiliicoccaceae archaeon]|nr:DUF6290 family protein [Methanomassiliicoccaceae archaeon]